MDVHTVSAYKTIQDWRFIPLDALEKLFSATKIIGNFNMAKKLTLHWRLLRHDLLKPDQYHEEAVQQLLGYSVSKQSYQLEESSYRKVCVCVFYNSSYYSLFQSF